MGGSRARQNERVAFAFGAGEGGSKTSWPEIRALPQQGSDFCLSTFEKGTDPAPNALDRVVFVVAVPKIEIIGESDIYVKSGSTVSLKCVITQSLEEPAYIFWYHDNERVLDYDRRLKDIRVERIGVDTTVGTLILYQATKEDSGNYTCSPSNLDSSSVLLHVLNGKCFLFPVGRGRPDD